MARVSKNTGSCWLIRILLLAVGDVRNIRDLDGARYAEGIVEVDPGRLGKKEHETDLAARVAVLDVDDEMSADARSDGEVGLGHPHFLATRANCLTDAASESGRALFQQCLFSFH